MESADGAHVITDSASEITIRSTRAHAEGKPLPTDSMVTVSLSDTTEMEDDHRKVERHDTAMEEEKRVTRQNSFEEVIAEEEKRFSRATLKTAEILAEELRKSTASDRSRSNSSSSEESAHVDWEQLETTESNEVRDEGSDESTALLLARLEQENNLLATNPKSGLKNDPKASTKHRARSQSRPPSIQQLKKIVQDNMVANMRQSQLPSPPPMTDLEFWAALVRDYPQTVQRLPTLTSNKIRSGVPGPLRGIVWVSMAGARDKDIEEAYDRLVGEPSPYEIIINKDIGRSFPGVDMFRDAEGEGQKMLGRVLKCFSLYDPKIGYCQGLGFLVGPLLMQMGEKEAFCVLVRLMEDYDLRSCFLPDLSGLHLRIYQFQKLLAQHIPKVAKHLDELEVEAAYLSQWFLSFFATTCPLPMLFRIYDVIFAEGASETIMRVALSIMRRNEQRILASHEFEDVMQLLLSRALWDPYGRNAKSADELVNDFCSFTGVVTRERLTALEARFKDSQEDSPLRTSTFSNVQSAASRFLGRLWAPANNSKSGSTSPGLQAPSRPVSFLRRSPSKQSIASTLNSVEASDGSSTNTLSTVITEPNISRDSNGDAFSLKSHGEVGTSSIRFTVSNHDKDLHTQIEDLLTALSEQQREVAMINAHLQKEREERREDQRLMLSLVDKLRDDKPMLGKRRASFTDTRDARRRTTTIAELTQNKPAASTPDYPPDILSLLETLHTRLGGIKHHRTSSVFETKASLRNSLSSAHDQIKHLQTHSASLTRQLSESKRETQSQRDQLREARHRLQESYSERQRLERIIQELKNNARKPSLPWSSDADSSPGGLTRTDTCDSISSNGLRELKLARSASQRSAKDWERRTPGSDFGKRSSSLSARSLTLQNQSQQQAPTSQPTMDQEALLQELVSAKTAQAIAKQELEEMKAKYEGMKKLLGAQSPGQLGTSPGGGLAHKPSPSEPSTTTIAGGFFGRATSPAPASVATPPASTGGGWFWGKRSVSAAASPAEK